MISMHYSYFSFLVTAITFLSTAAVPPPLPSTLQPPTKNRYVPEPSDVEVYAVGDHGAPLNQKATILFFHIIQLEIYKDTLARGGDAFIAPSGWERNSEGMSIDFFPDPKGVATWADALYGLQRILRGMMDPGHTDGFREQIYGVGHRNPGASSSSFDIVAQISLKLEVPDSSLLNGSASVASSSSMARFNSSSLFSSIPLSVPFVVPETDMTLLIGSRGADLLRAAVVLSLDQAIAVMWRDVAIRGQAQPVRDLASEITVFGARFWIIVSSRKSSGVSFFTGTDLVEAVIGTVYYMVPNGFFATKITAVRPDGGGRRIPVGEIELSVERPRDGGVVLGNNSLFQVLNVIESD